MNGRANPYASWENGLNENTNGLVRQHIAKKSRFDTGIDDEIDFIMHRLNHRPRKNSLGSKSAKVYCKLKNIGGAR